MSLFNRVTGRPLIVDELDEPVLHLGSGDQALNLQERFLGPRGPVINVDLRAQPNLALGGRAATAPVLTEFPGTGGPFHHQGDATDLNALRGFSPTGRFREIHAVNPYGFNPHTTFPLLSSTGRMFITGQNTNPYAQDTALVTRGNPRRNIPHVFAAPSPTIARQSSALGTMHPEHATLTHQLTGGQPLDVSRSRTHTLSRM